jgi:pyruvyltransferase
VRHYANEVGSISGSDEVVLIDPLRDPTIVVPEILSCEFVVSSSLHGIIVAESFGIPARWLRSDKKGPASMKFYDYYLQTGRAPRPAATLEAAILAGGEPLPDLDDEILLQTFPWDIYPSSGPAD